MRIASANAAQIRFNSFCWNGSTSARIELAPRCRSAPWRFSSHSWTGIPPCDCRLTSAWILLSSFSFDRCSDSGISPQPPKSSFQPPAYQELLVCRWSRSAAQFFCRSMPSFAPKRSSFQPAHSSASFGRMRVHLGTGWVANASLEATCCISWDSFLFFWPALCFLRDLRLCVHTQPLVFSSSFLWTLYLVSFRLSLTSAHSSVVFYH